MAVEKTTCASRMNQYGPWKHGEMLDLWETDRWNADIEKQNELNKQYLSEQEEKHGPGTTIISDTHKQWLWSWGPPRTCSFCGSIHPEDAIRLALEGWEVDVTRKRYKCYLNPPGHLQASRSMLRNLKKTGEPTGPSVWSPVPPIKLYSWHLSKEQVDKFNTAIELNSP